MKKKNLIITMVLACTLLFTAMTCIAFADDDYEAISVGQTKKVTYTEDNEGYTTFAFTPQESCTYLFESSRYNGQYSDPYGTVFVLEDGEWTELASNGDIDEYDYMFRVAFAAEAGKTYYLEAYVDEDETCNVSVKKSPVQAIEFLPKERYTYTENAGGDWEWEDEEETSEQFYYYYIPSFINGDVLKITKDNGSVLSYTYSYDEEDDEGYFVRSGGDSISEEEIERNSNQYEKHWVLGTDNELTISYKGVECKVPVEIIENPYTGFEFRPAKPYKFVEYGYGEWDTDDEDNEYFDYTVPWYENGDQLIITLKDGGTIVYTYSEDDEGFYSADGKFIDEYDIDSWNDQDEVHWEKGKENYITYEYMGFEFKLLVEIIDNPVKSISFTPFYTYTCVAEDKEIGEYDYDDNDKKFFYYYLPGFNEGDILTVTTEEGTKNYVYKYYDEEENYDGYFVCDGEMIPEEYVEYNSNQYEKHWTGGTNYYTVKYSGRECKVAVEIKKAKQPMTVKPVKKTFKAKALKKKKAVFKPVTVKNYKGKLTYKAKASGKSKKVLSFSSKTKKLTVKKGAKKGKYTIKITVTAAGNSSFLKGSKTVKVVVTVK